MEEPPSSSSNPPPLLDSDDDDDSVLSNAEFLTRQELIKRRLRRLRRLQKYYRHYYWWFMEGVKRKHRDYYWMYGKSPYRDEDEGDLKSDDKLGLGFENCGGEEGGFKLCCVPNCNAKAMALSRYCFEHILLDSKQVLYKGCIYPHKRSDEHGVGPILCNKPLLKFTTPSLCPKHSQDARKHISQALKKGGVPVSTSSKLSSKFHFHLVIKEYVNLIQSRRRAIASKNIDFIAVDNHGP